jgi:hypothetical protein
VATCAADGGSWRCVTVSYLGRPAPPPLPSRAALDSVYAAVFALTHAQQRRLRDALWMEHQHIMGSTVYYDTKGGDSIETLAQVGLCLYYELEHRLSQPFPADGADPGAGAAHVQGAVGLGSPDVDGAQNSGAQGVEQEEWQQHFCNVMDRMKARRLLAASCVYVMPAVTAHAGAIRASHSKQSWPAR